MKSVRHIAFVLLGSWNLITVCDAIQLFDLWCDSLNLELFHTAEFVLDGHGYEMLELSLVKNCLILFVVSSFFLVFFTRFCFPLQLVNICLDPSAYRYKWWKVQTNFVWVFYLQFKWEEDFEAVISVVALLQPLVFVSASQYSIEVL